MANSVAWISDLASDIVETIREPLLVLNSSLRVEWANRVFCQSFGCSLEELANSPLAEIDGGLWNNAELLELLSHVLPERQVVTDFELSLGQGPKPDRLLMLNARQMKTPNTGDALILLAMEDITEQRRVSAQQARLAALVESSDDAIIAQTFDGRIVDWNAGAEMTYGYSAEEAVGQNISMIIPDDRRKETENMRDTLLQGKLIRNRETQRQHKNGKLIPVSLTLSPIRDAGGRVVLLSTIERDISRRVKRQLELQEALAMAEQASQARAEFVANVSHELRTPMVAIIGMTDLSLDEDLPAEVRDNLQTVRTSADVLMELIDEVLDFSKLESGQFELESAPFGIRELCDSLAKAMGLRAYEKGLELVNNVADDVPDRLVGDALRLRQLISNLVSNAIKFTESGEIEVSVSLQRKTRNAVILRFAVRDTGIGVAAEDRERIFAPFTQGDASSTRSYGGTGLGLTICRQLAELMGGKLAVESNSEGGSTFSFDAKLECAPDTERHDESPQDRLRDLKGMPVLVVDDNETNRKLLERTLANWSLNPVTVESGEAALEELRTAADQNRRFPLVILDALMPDMDGFDVASEIEQDPDLAQSTVLMLSSADRKAFRDRLNEVELSAFLEKPVTQSDLWDSIVSTMDGLPVRQGQRGARDLRQTAARSLNILLVEDTPANQKVVSRILEKRGHQVEIAHNGRDALEKLDSSSIEFDLVLMDVQMPIMDGFQTTSAIRKLDNTDLRSLPIIAMTAHAMKGDREKCLAAGMDSYLSKPIDARKLVTLVESYVFKESLADRSGSESVTWDAGGFPQLLDIEAALTRLGGDRELLHDMLEFFTEDVPPLLQQIRTSLGEQDADQLERAAHSLKGLLANFDAGGQVVSMAAELQEQGSKGNFQSAAKLIPRLERRSIRMVREAETIRQNHADKPG